MFSKVFYPYIITSMISGLLTLLGSVGIFISIILQRKVERLQAILEEFIDLSNNNNMNLSGKMYNLIQKYQMHYILPQNPRRIILIYLNATLGLALTLWTLLYFLIYEGPFIWITVFYLLPLVGIILIMGWFRRLLYYLISIDSTPLLSSIIPPPKKLHSVSYLSSYINLSVKSVLRQARLSLLIKQENTTGTKNPWVVTLKEELSFDDFHYFLVISDKDCPLFISFGEILFDFPIDSITGKPCPIKKNINVPIGNFIVDNLSDDLNACLLIFTRGERNPLKYDLDLKFSNNYYTPASDLDISIEHQITYSIENNQINILENESSLPFIKELSSMFILNNKINYLPINNNNLNKGMLISGDPEVYVD
ncbi:hypothetical protein SAMN00017405_0837 [Desulfonispora thiosulfatigenes DSM 11270]|uniref:Uncharacterized protein n=1 Tax=Desulfonispora thiosulfatigenes DSM 11270 TaxID=656914 RepID=A0A1W1UGC1_DESTI|nr:hypothetical protein [Desulfonispora thiosulfatigenes]SMB80110.1 hypothetical protein SAMN00017405_0837 [Desulfonispora thiosulfatigenes DSM 11270]